MYAKFLFMVMAKPLFFSFFGGWRVLQLTQENAEPEEGRVFSMEVVSDQLPFSWGRCRYMTACWGLHSSDAETSSAWKLVSRAPEGSCDCKQMLEKPN